MIRFSNFEIDRQRAELRGVDGTSIRVRPKTFEVLYLLVSNTGRVVSKQELMDAVWPSVHVSDDSLFQCIKELRTALGDVDRTLIKAVSGRGYLLDAVVTDDTAPASVAAPAGELSAGARQSRRSLQPRFAVPALVGLLTLAMLAIGAPALLSDPGPSTLAVMPIVDVSNNPAGATLSVAMTEELIDGLAKIDGLRVVAPSTGSVAAGMAIVSELDQSTARWTLKSRLVDSATGEVHGVATIEVDGSVTDQKRLQTRLVAGIGDQLARSLNTLRDADSAKISTASKVAIEQAAASINQTSRERFAVAEAMLSAALGAEPDNIDLQVALAALQLRGLQMAWYDPDQRATVQDQAAHLLDSALQTRPGSIAALEAQCRLHSTAARYAESLVACGQVLRFDPWNGTALYLVGLGQLYLGRFEDALATFTLADHYDTPAVSRWTWLLGAGWANLLMGRDEGALAWLERSVAITAASGRSHMLMAVAYGRLVRIEEAQAAMAAALQSRPGSTVENVRPSSQNASPVFIEAVEETMQVMARLGLPHE